MKHQEVTTATERTFSVLLQPEPEGGFTVLVPSLPEIVSYGETEAEALDTAKEAIKLALEVREEQGKEIPGEVESRTEAVTVAFELLSDQVQLEQVKLDRLRAEIQKGLDSGESEPLDMDSIIAEARKRYRQRTAQ